MADSDTRHGGSSPEGKVHNHTEQGFAGQGGARARELWGEVSAGARHFSLKDRKPPEGRLRQFFYGMSLPFHIGGALLGDPVARRQYIRVGFLQSIAALALALSCMTSGTEAAESASKRESRAEARAKAARIREVAEALVDQHDKKEAAAATRRAKEVEAQTIQRLQEIDAQVARRKQAAAQRAGEGTPSGPEVQPEPTAVVPSLSGAGDESPESASTGEAEDVAGATPDAQKPSPIPADTPDARLEQRIRDVEAAAQGADAGTSLAKAITALVMEATKDLDSEAPASSAKERTDATEDAPHTAEDTQAPVHEKSTWTVKGLSVWGLAFWAALFAALQLAQWVVIALSRDYHDAISRKASLLTGLEPEDEEFPPRVRLNVAWLRKKVKRRWRAFLLLMVGVPALVLITLPFMCASRFVFTALFTAWGAWWWVVFTAAKSARAWEPSAGATRPPWFLRVWTVLTTRVPGFRWGSLQRYGASWGRRTEEVFAPISSTERHPWVFAGLAVVRFLGSFPPMKFFVRPLIPVASAHLLEEDVAAARKALAAGANASPPEAEVPRPADVW
ncbi:hypothetical protein MXAN_2469 [Myxococcus xanthus DK 1622]|uniref:Uncharacterized protein n=2 Tax=Myxococcaceae TaxID=31 RepID=Q1D9I4_MYXXD|nr:hypothetical protein MXAN_2469 [Myxococcus xanthus DK 1622]NOJ53813.1 hypothetical protein [Myxococcus xanthus]QVW71234.1 hypothetical protein JTM82_17590 [Myxococcus xanthus DZ2]QPM81985.1 hypothetical protein I5Q59_12235 [Myxococcus xanthus]QZZ50195.1 hypothetical protein MyxoNM_13375 [Myxococcus xanthus]